MNRKNLLKSTAATAAMLAMLSSATAAPDTSLPGISLPSSPDLVKIELLRQKVKYVFVIFHENESFDHYFGTYPGATGLFEAPHGFTPANQTPSFTQRFLGTSLNVKYISPFLMPQAVVGNGGSNTNPRSAKTFRRSWWIRPPAVPPKSR